MSKRQIEMVWCCSSCGHRNLGRHTVCQGCGNPKDGSERYEMPGETASAPSVTDPALLRMAQAGVNWQCAYCGSHQRRYDGTCGRCGAAQAAGHDAERAAPREPPGSRAAARRPASRPARGALVVLALAMLSCLGFCGAGALFRALGPAPPVPLGLPKTHFVAEVVASAWTRTIDVERYREVTREGFAEQIPADAFARESRGPRHHHDEQVPDGFDTQHYTERVQAGFDTESYTERVLCGQTCTPRAQQCHEVCTPNGNGFATCEQRCSGGGEDCSPRYCDEPRTRQVPRYVDEPRTRQVPRFRAEPRLAEWFSYRVWAWERHRTLQAEGQGAEAPRWPAATEVALGEGLAEGERERERRSETFVVRLRAHQRIHAHHLSSESAYAEFPLGSLHFVRLPPDGSFRIEARLSP